MTGLFKASSTQVTPRYCHRPPAGVLGIYGTSVHNFDIKLPNGTASNVSIEVFFMAKRLDRCVTNQTMK